MITTGFRELVINQDSRISGTTGQTASVLNIDGLGEFLTANTTVTAVIDPIAAVAGEYVVTLPALALGSSLTVNIYLSLPGRVLSEFFPEPEGSVSFTAIGDGTTSAAALIAAMVIPGFNDKAFTLSATGNNLNIVFLSGYEGTAVSRVGTETAVAGNSENVKEVSLAVTTTVEANEGLNTGRLLEASVVLATPANLEYGMNEYGHDRIDIRGSYKAYVYEVTTPREGWEAHEAMGHQDVNQALNYKTVKYIVYANTASVTQAKHDLLTLVVVP